MLTESMIGGLTGWLSSPAAVVLDRNIGDRLQDVVAGDQFADDRILIVAVDGTAVVMKNWQSLVSGPLLANASRPEEVNRISTLNSSSWTLPRAAVGAAAAAAGAQRIAALNHEVLDDAVKRQAVVET